jgi:hypothetical protein
MMNAANGIMRHSSDIIRARVRIKVKLAQARRRRWQKAFASFLIFIINNHKESLWMLYNDECSTSCHFLRFFIFATLEEAPCAH